MTDESIVARIERLVAEEHDLRARDAVDRHVARPGGQGCHRRHVAAVRLGGEARSHGPVAPPRTEEHQLSLRLGRTQDLEAQHPSSGSGISRVVVPASAGSSAVAHRQKTLQM